MMRILFPGEIIGTDSPLPITLENILPSGDPDLSGDGYTENDEYWLEGIDEDWEELDLEDRYYEGKPGASEIKAQSAPNPDIMPVPKPPYSNNETEASAVANVNTAPAQLNLKAADSGLELNKKSDISTEKSVAKGTDISIQKQYSNAMQIAVIISLLESVPAVYKYVTNPITWDRTAGISKTVLRNWCGVTGMTLGGLTTRILTNTSIPGLQTVATFVGAKCGKEIGEYLAVEGNKLIDYYIAPAPAKADTPNAS
jgi:hypothetical protein